MFTCAKTIYLRDTDATGVLFFTELPRLSLEVFEDFLASLGFTLNKMLQEEDFLLPIVHLEADYFVPMQVGDRFNIRLMVEKIKTTSFSLKYEFYALHDERLSGTVSITHVCVSKHTKRPIDIPSKLHTFFNLHTSSLEEL